MAAASVGLKKMSTLIGNLIPEMKPKQVDRDETPGEIEITFALL